MARLPQRILSLATGLVAVGLFVAPAGACPFCGNQGPTLTGEVAQAKLVLYGRLQNAKALDNGGGTTDLAVESVIKNELAGMKDDPLAAGRRTVRLEQYLPRRDEDDSYRYLVFCDLFRGKIDPYRVVSVRKDGGMARYLLGALGHKDEPIGKRLRFFFDYLDSADVEISNDAYREFANADYKDYRDMAKELPAERVAKWLTHKDTPAFRYGLYASMLGHCGKAEHADVLRHMLDDKEKRLGSGVDGMLAGYVMLKPREGWAYTRDLLRDEKNDFMLRYAALRAVRFLWDYRTDLVRRDDLKDGVALLLGQTDIADLAIDELRKRECWDLAGRVLALKDGKAYDLPIVRRAMLRFALQCPNNKAAAGYVAEQRRQDAQGVADAEELLKLEQMPAPAPASK